MPSRSEVKVILLNHNVTNGPNTLLFPILPLASDCQQRYPPISSPPLEIKDGYQS